MGYYTSYSLEILDDPDGAIMDDLRNSSEWAAYALQDDGSTNESCKWYEWKEDMTEFSKLYPEALFILRGEGEEIGDIWRAYFKDGKAEKQKVKMVFDTTPDWALP